MLTLLTPLLREQQVAIGAIAAGAKHGMFAASFSNLSSSEA